MEHFFATRGDADSLPVVNLLVTPEELAIAAADSNADPKLVRDAFVAALLDELPDGKDLLAHAMDMPCHVDFPDVRPGFVAHLILSCIAAAESSAELAREGSYRDRLNILTRGRTSEGTLHFLRDLWEKLQKWLASPRNLLRYRQLVLPSLGTHTRIGYSEGLAFPDRKDQRALGLLLREHGLAGEMPPPAPLLRHVGANLGLFGKAFVAAYQDFRSRYLAAGTPASELRAHRFWSAAVDAALRARAPEESDPTIGADLLVIVDSDELELLLLATAAIRQPPRGCEFADLRCELGDWRSAIVDATTKSSARAVSNLLTGVISVRGVSRIARQGFIPLTPILFDYLGPATRIEELREARHALVRDDLVPAIRSIFGGTPHASKPAENWTLLSGASFRAFDSGEKRSAALEAVWLLQPSLCATRLTLCDGIRADDGWLGYAEVLPTVKMPGATQITATSTENTFNLDSLGDARWGFPHRDLDGQFEILAYQDKIVLARTQLRFVSGLASEAYKYPRDLHACYVEHRLGTKPLVDIRSFVETDEQADVGLQTGRVILLGPAHGEFVTDESRAAWKIIRTGPKTTLITLADSDLAGMAPTSRAITPRLRRRWRTLLDQSTPADGLDVAARVLAARRVLHSRVELPTVSFEVDSRVASSRGGLPPVAEQVQRLVAAIAGRASARAGLPFAEWRGLLARFIGLPEVPTNPDLCAVEALTRCWSEAGYIEVVTTARWRSRLIYASAPTLVAFRSGPTCFAVLVGLCLPNTVRDLSRNAEAVGVRVEERRSACAFVPSTIVLSASEPELLRRVAHRIPMKWANLEDMACPSSLEEGLAPPPNYEKGRQIRPSFIANEVGQARITQWIHENRPPYWVAACSGVSAWSYSKNIARLHACRMAGVSPFLPSGEHDISVAHAYLPLPLARRVALLGPMLPGPESLMAGGAGHLYAFGTPIFRDQILAMVNP